MITNQLPQLLAQKGTSIRQLARDTGITYSTIWAMVHGRRRSVQLEVLDAVCEALALQPGDIYRHLSAGDKATEQLAPHLAREQDTKTVEDGSRPNTGRDDLDWRSW